MKYKFCGICINVTKYVVTFATKGVSNPPPRAYATAVKFQYTAFVSEFQFSLSLQFSVFKHVVETCLLNKKHQNKNHSWLNATFFRQCRL